jgi:outer membrane protein assembly factor BamB
MVKQTLALLLPVLIAACSGWYGETKELHVEGTREPVFAVVPSTPAASSAVIKLPPAAITVPVKIVTTINAGRAAPAPYTLIAPPIFTADRLYAGDGRGRVSAFTRTGQRQWRTDTTPSGQSGTPIGGLALAEDLLFVATGASELLALDSATGAIKWRAALAAPARAAPLVFADKVAVMTAAGTVETFAVATGDRSWLYAHKTARNSALFTTARLLYHQDDVFAALPGGTLVSLASATGSLKILELISPYDTEFNPVATTPVIKGNDIYLASYNGPFSRLNKATGARTIIAPVGSASDMLALGQVMVLTTTDHHLLAYNTADNSEVYDIKLSAPLTPVVLFGNLLAAGQGHNLLLFDAATGALVQTLPLPGQVTAAPVVMEDSLLVITDNAYLLVIA